ncbi:hypothetical protein SQ11_14105 [Nitrosospira sp. NpAV]|nr:hypothetical protein SQ11_14105 [Nitrosospira sp. NpAV]
MRESYDFIRLAARERLWVSFYLHRSWTSLEAAQIIFIKLLYQWSNVIQKMAFILYKEQWMIPLWKFGGIIIKKNKNDEWLLANICKLWKCAPNLNHPGHPCDQIGRLLQDWPENDQDSK